MNRRVAASGLRMGRQVRVEGASALQVEEIRAAKLAEMEAAGIPAKYCAELANKKLVNF